MQTNQSAQFLSDFEAGQNGIHFIGAVENMQIYYGNGFKELVDVFALNGHDRKWREDLLRLRESGTQLVRYPIPWHRIELREGKYDWEWTDEVLRFAEEIGLEFIADPCHMKSFPLWLDGGFLNPRFADVYLKFVQRLADRYPWLTHWTAFNEPFTTSVMWGHSNKWCERGNCDKSFVRTLAHICRGWSEVSQWLRQDYRTVLVHCEAAEHHGAWPRGHKNWDAHSEHHAAFQNERSMVATDLALGLVEPGHPMLGFLREGGLTRDEEAWFQENPVPIDVMGWDYYAHTSEHFWQGQNPGWQRPSPMPLGMFEIFKKYIRRYPGYDVMVGETNLPGFVTDRTTWLRYVTEEAVRIQAWLEEEGRPERFLGLCWFPSFDSHSWTEAEMARVTVLDPTGIWWLDEKKLNRHDSELSAHWSRLAQGTFGYQDIPVHKLNPDLMRDLAGFKKLLPRGAF